MARATQPAVLIRLLERVWPDHPVEKMGQEHMVLCPFCDTSKNKLAVNPEKGVFQCWVCGERGPIFKLLEQLLSLRVITVADMKAVVSGGVLSRLTDAVTTHKKVEEKKHLWSATSPCVYPPHVYSLTTFTPKNILAGRIKQAAYNYLDSRGVSIKDIKRYRLAVCCNLDSVYHGHIFIPALGSYGRQLVFWTTRAMSDRVSPKSLHASKKYSRFSAKHIVMNEHFITGNEVAICEGPFDAFSIMAATGIPAIPLLGKVLHPYHASILRQKGIEKVYICLDPDAVASVDNLANRLESETVKVYPVFLAGGDPNDVSHETLKAAFEKATSNFDNSLSFFVDQLRIP